MDNWQTDCKMGLIYMLWLTANNSWATVLFTNWNLQAGFKGTPLLRVHYNSLVSVLLWHGSRMPDQLSQCRRWSSGLNEIRRRGGGAGCSYIDLLLQQKCLIQCIQASKLRRIPLKEWSIMSFIFQHSQAMYFCLVRVQFQFICFLATAVRQRLKTSTAAWGELDRYRMESAQHPDDTQFQICISNLRAWYTDRTVWQTGLQHEDKSHTDDNRKPTESYEDIWSCLILNEILCPLKSVSSTQTGSDSPKSKAEVFHMTYCQICELEMPGIGLDLLHAKQISLSHSLSNLVSKKLFKPIQSTIPYIYFSP